MMEELKKKGIAAVSFKREGMSLAEMKALMQLNAVKVLTVHVAKGLENKNVLIYGDSFKLIKPSWMKNEEEIRLMYVAITRAKENLFILN
jgi:superfamily I DNA/RNA helicase